MRKFCTLILWGLLLCFTTPVMAQLSELSGKVINAIGSETSSFITSQWYLMYNRGRGTYAYERSGGMIYVKNSEVPVVGDNATSKSAFLIRLVDSDTSGKYYIQTGNGNYFGSLTEGNNNGVTSDKSVMYSCNTINGNAGHFFFNDGNNMIMDANGPGDASLAGWGYGSVTSINGNNDWALYPVTLSTPTNLSGAELLEYQLENYSLFRLKNRNPYSTGWSNPMLTENDNNNLSIKDKSSNSDLSQIWIIEPSDNGYTLRNAKSGRYINNLNTGSTSSSNTAPKVYYIKYSDNNSDNSTNYITISATDDFSGRNSLHHQDYGCDGGGNNLVVWDAGSNGNATASDWSLEIVSEISEDNIRNHFNEMRDIDSEIIDGKIYRFISNCYGSVMTEMLSDNSVKCTPIDEDNFAQYWRVIANEDNYILQNVLTERYIQVQGGAFSVPYSTGSAQNSFAINESSDKWLSSFTIADYGEVGLHCASSQGDYVVGWYTSVEASVWCVKSVDLTDEQIEEAKQDYNTYCNFKENKTVIQARLMHFFEDYACTTLKDEYQTMPDVVLQMHLENNDITNPLLQEMIFKVKNNSWQTYDDAWDKTEKTFRIADYKVYSDWDWDAWTAITQNGYCFSRLSNPTGISGKCGDVILIFVDSDIPSGVSLQIEAVNGTNSAGSNTPITKGLNSIILSEDANLFVYYTAEVTNDGYGNFSYPELSDIADIKIHIEGGSVNGYFDLTKGDNNIDWSKLQSYLLKDSEVINLKTDYLLFNMNCELVKQCCPIYMVELLTIWDNIIKSQHELMGIEDYDGYFNNLLVAASINDSYMYASSYGTYYNETTLPSVMSYEEMNTTGAIWGPAHENGHIHQNVINMVGCTEVSNNMFSNVAVYKQGRFTMRADELSTTINNFANNVHWTARDIWEQCLMYTKLYYYYHVLGNNTEFYPNLFRALRNDPLDRRNGVTIRLKDESLKFVRHVCDVAKEDLTEFFKVFGFFETPQSNGYDLGYHKDDYGSFYIDTNPTTVSADIEETLEYIKGKNYPKNNNIIFIDDRIKPSSANYAGMLNGAVREDFNDEHPIGEVGEVGQYEDFTDEFKCNGYKFNLDNGNVTIEGEGAVGFKVYDQNGELVYISNTKVFTIPSDILNSLDSNFDIVATEGNGKDIEIADASETIYDLDVYYGASDKKVVYSNGEAISLPDNALAFITGSNRYNAPSALTNSTNVVNALSVAEEVVVKENSDFYSPYDFTATIVNFDRDIDANEMRLLVVPFDVNSNSINGDVYSFDKVKDNMVNFTSYNGTLSANTPYLIYSESSDNIIAPLENATIRATPSTMSVGDGNASLVSSYKRGAASDNLYEYVDGGFEKLQEEWLPFETMLLINGSEVFDRYIISFNGEATGIEIPASDNSIFPANVYDLSGRLIRVNAESLKGLSNGIYIVNGLKIIWQE